MRNVYLPCLAVLIVMLIVIFFDLMESTNQILINATSVFYRVGRNTLICKVNVVFDEAPVQR